MENNTEKLSFQQALSRLEQIVEQLNNSSLELETAIELFKEGTLLSRQCEDQLKSFENQITQLMKADASPKDGYEAG